MNKYYYFTTQYESRAVKAHSIHERYAMTRGGLIIRELAKTDIAIYKRSSVIIP